MTIVYLLYRGFEGNKYLINVYNNKDSAERQSDILKSARRYDYWVESTRVRN